MLIFSTYLGIGTLSTTRASSELAVAPRDGDTTSVSESDAWLCFFFHNGKEYDFDSIFGRLERSGIRTHSLSNLTTRLLPSASELAPGIMIDEARTVISGRKTVLVIVADIGYRWRRGRQREQRNGTIPLLGPGGVALKGHHHLHSDQDKRP